MACEDTRQLTEQQRQDAYQQQRTGVQRAVRPFTGSPTVDNLIDYINRELAPAVRQTRSAVNDVYNQARDNAPSGNPLQYYFSTTTTNADPTSGRIRLDSATQDTATTIRLSQSNARLQDVVSWLDVMAGSATAPLGTVTLFDAINPARFLRFDLNTMVDQGAYWDLGVSILESSHDNPFVDDAAVVLAFIPGVAGAGATVPPSSITPIAANTVVANATASTAAPTAVSVGTNTVLGRVAGNIVAAQLVNAQITDGTIANAKLASMAASTLKGRAEGAGTGAPTDLTATQVASIIDGEVFSWLANHSFGAQIILGTQQNETGSLPLAITLNETTTRLYILVAGTGDIRTITPSGGVTTAGRAVLVYIVGTGTKTVKHAFSGGGVGRIQCPNDVDFVVGNRDSFLLIGDTTNGWLATLLSSTPMSLTDGDKGDITVSSNGATWTVDNDVVSDAKLRNSAGLSVIGRASNSTGDPADITSTTARHALITNSAGTAVGWRALETADIPAHTWAQVLAAGATSGTSNPIVSAGQYLGFGTTPPTLGLSEQLRSDGAFTGYATGALTLVSTDSMSLTGDVDGNSSFVLLNTSGQITLGHASGQFVSLPSFLKFTTEAAASTPSMSAGQALHWVRNDTPNVPMFTDDANTDHVLQYRGEGMLADGDKGDITVSGSFLTWTIDNDVVSDAKLANMAQSSIKGRSFGAGTGDPESLTGEQVGEILRRETVVLDTTISGTVTTYTVADNTTQVIFTGSGSATVHGMTATAGSIGKTVTFEVDSTGSVTVDFVNESGSAASSVNRIRTPSGQTLRLSANTRAVMSYYEFRWRVESTSGVLIDGDRGDITVSASGATWTIDNGVVSNAKLANVTAGTVKGMQVDGSTGAPVDLTGLEVAELLRVGTTQAVTFAATSNDQTLNADANVLRVTCTGSQTLTGIASGSAQGRLLLVENISGSGNNLTLASLSASSLTANRIRTPNGVDLVLRFRETAILRWETNNGDWRVVATARATAIADGDYGDITVSSAGAAWTIDNDAVSDAKLANMSQGTIKGRSLGAGTGDPESLTGAQAGAITRWTAIESFTLTAGTTNTIALANGTTWVYINISGVGNVVIDEITYGSSTAERDGVRIILAKNTGTGNVILRNNTGKLSNQITTPNSSADWVLEGALSAVLIGHNTFSWCLADRATTLATFPTIADDTFLANISGATAVPTAVALSTLAGDGLTGGADAILNVGAGTFISVSASAVSMDWASFLTATDSTSIVIGSNTYQRAALTGDVTAAQDSNATTIATAAVTLAKMADLAQSRIIGRAEGAGTGVPTALTPTQVMSIVDGESVTWTGVHTFTGAGLTTNVTDDLLLGSTNGVGLFSGLATSNVTNGDMALNSIGGIAINANTAGTLVTNPANGDVEITASSDVSITAAQNITIAGAGAGVTIITGGVQTILTAGSTIDLNSPHTLNSTTRLTAILTSSMTGNLDNLDVGSYNVVRLSPDAGARRLRGMAAGGDGQLVLLCNTSTSFSFNIIDESDTVDGTSSSAANRFRLPATTSQTLGVSSCCFMWYDGTTDRWRLR